MGCRVLMFEHLQLIRHVLYHLSHASRPYPFSYFSGSILCFCLGHHNFPTSISFVAGITGVFHHTQPVF
jgi:hypothetical protein